MNVDANFFQTLHAAPSNAVSSDARVFTYITFMQMS
jgi:hypothetical protein